VESFHLLILLAPKTTTSTKESIMYLGEGREQRITNIDSSKKTISLSDNSKWEATGIYGYKVSIWLPTHKVVVKKSGLNYKMTNNNKNETVDVKHLS
jgi:arginine/lysine/ornithine decarboxylase